jgi:hypothetical protein
MQSHNVLLCFTGQHSPSLLIRSLRDACSLHKISLRVALAHDAWAVFPKPASVPALAVLATNEQILVLHHVASVPARQSMLVRTGAGLCRRRAARPGAAGLRPRDHPRGHAPQARHAAGRPLQVQRVDRAGAPPPLRATALRCGQVLRLGHTLCMCDIPGRFEC